MSENAEVLRQLGDLNAEMRVVTYRVGKVEQAVERRAGARDVDTLREEVTTIKAQVGEVSERVSAAQQAVADRINRRDNLTKLAVALLGSGGLAYLVLQALIGG